ncbi:hypothetical protein CI102_12111 [Trichoderma harzianum]|uniref:Uncharacterized protein n=1 Tax=Trichoderma harzianum CBS 226.95 TaxID=983964 RepID=A0A2T4AGR3_TRIHA|nr:hypothetical protein M431DRAFT_371883 [Trichoderma harzianum CBS 226.95]PKK44058.1 hypothetical protein CI102_12111 [Trichoderma harzianum]PTB56275.1 hypothetical protein M431DRAFT_371883 [Trichoderma harzianum CBS 226.95]
MSNIAIYWVGCHKLAGKHKQADTRSKLRHWRESSFGFSPFFSFFIVYSFSTLLIYLCMTGDRMERNKRNIGWINGWSKREGRMRETAWNEWVSCGGSTGFHGARSYNVKLMVCSCATILTIRGRKLTIGMRNVNFRASKTLEQNCG